MTTDEALYAILGNNCPQNIETVDSVEWSFHEIELHCLTVKIWCRFEGETVIVRSVEYV